MKKLSPKDDNLANERFCTEDGVRIQQILSDIIFEIFHSLIKLCVFFDSFVNHFNFILKNPQVSNGIYFVVKMSSSVFRYTHEYLDVPAYLPLYYLLHVHFISKIFSL